GQAPGALVANPPVVANGAKPALPPAPEPVAEEFEHEKPAAEFGAPPALPEPEPQPKATAADRKKLEKAVEALAAANSETDWDEMAEKAAQKTYNRPLAELSKPQLTELVERMNKLLETMTTGAPA